MLLRKRINTACKSAFRSCHKAIRLMETYNKLISDKTSKHKPTFINLIETGTCTMISGYGALFEKFRQKKIIDNYSVQDSKFSYPDDVNYWNSKLRFVPFDDIFTFLPTDVSSRTLNINCVFCFPKK